ncbi:MAG: MarR family transcriptional regulator [Rhodospirillum sp.]|nr:MarR family transcriptional regulator [Rhodospirillum sp.]MCF8490328.1 MarR family transcriptional regulator [Rhodospirillum sp.]MCF8502037.1 MarR family transcriptional regulator [Rhodospirillum sp.]
MSPAAIADQLSRLGRTIHGQEFVLGLNPAQWMALRYFKNRDERERTVMRFAEYYGSSRGTASQTISALVRKGYLVRTPNPAKRSSRLLDVTAAGLQRLDQDPQGHLILALGRLPEETLDSLSLGITRLLQSLTDG